MDDGHEASVAGGGRDDLAGGGVGGRSLWRLDRQAELGPQFKYILMGVLTAGEKDLSAPCVAVQGKALRTVGQRSGANLRFGYDTDYKGHGLHLDFNGNVGADGAVISGTADAGARPCPSGDRGLQQASRSRTVLSV